MAERITGGLDSSTILPPNYPTGGHGYAMDAEGNDLQIHDEPQMAMGLGSSDNPKPKRISVHASNRQPRTNLQAGGCRWGIDR